MGCGHAQRDHRTALGDSSQALCACPLLSFLLFLSFWDRVPHRPGAHLWQLLASPQGLPCHPTVSSKAPAQRENSIKSALSHIFIYYIVNLKIFDLNLIQEHCKSKQLHTEINQTQRLYCSMHFHRIRKEAVKLHMGFHSFTIKYICMFLPSTKSEKKSMTELERVKQLVCILVHNPCSLPAFSPPYYLAFLVLFPTWYTAPTIDVYLHMLLAISYKWGRAWC